MLFSPTSDTTTQSKADSKDFWVNMPNLISHLKKVAEQKPQATYYNVDMLKYQVSSALAAPEVSAICKMFLFFLMNCRNNMTLFKNPLMLD